MSREKPQAQTLNKHPKEYQEDLNPNAMAGQNIGLGETDPSKGARSAYDLKDVHRQLANISDDDLKRIRILDEGARLEQGGTYLDLNKIDRGEFTATGEITATKENLFIAKKNLDYNLWNLLIGVDNPERVEPIKEKSQKQNG